MLRLRSEVLLTATEGSTRQRDCTEWVAAQLKRLREGRVFLREVFDVALSHGTNMRICEDGGEGEGLVRGSVVLRPGESWRNTVIVGCMSRFLLCGVDPRRG